MKEESKREGLKTIRVSNETHKALVEYCKKNSLKVNDFSSKLLLKTIRNLENGIIRDPEALS